jgi:putative DNA primase/helicase
VGFHPDADCPRWRKFMATIFSGDAERVAFVQRALGYSLVTDVSGDSVFFCYGSGRNGKSTMFEVLRKIWGDYLVQLPIEALLSQNRGARDLTGSAEVTRLHGARIAWTSEIPEDRRLNEALVKDLTGGDTITARRLYQNPFTFSPTHKLWMTGNHQPEIRGIDEGIWRRIHLIPFDHQFPRDGEPSYRDRASVLAELETEGPGILNWLLEGLQKYREQGLNPPAVVRRATEHYRKESDVLADFIEERCVQGPQLTVTSADLWNAYVTFCSGGRPAYSTKRALAAAMTQRGFQLHHTAKHRMIKGLALRRDDYRPDDDAYDA